jgi:hypothetical protein
MLLSHTFVSSIFGARPSPHRFEDDLASARTREVGPDRVECGHNIDMPVRSKRLRGQLNPLAS